MYQHHLRHIEDDISIHCCKDFEKLRSHCTSKVDNRPVRLSLRLCRSTEESCCYTQARLLGSKLEDIDTPETWFDHQVTSVLEIEDWGGWSRLTRHLQTILLHFLVETGRPRLSWGGCVWWIGMDLGTMYGQPASQWGFLHRFVSQWNRSILIVDTFIQ